MVKTLNFTELIGDFNFKHTSITQLASEERVFSKDMVSDRSHLLSVKVTQAQFGTYY